MALSIKTDEADRLARALAAETHESLTEAVTVALRERLDRVRKSSPAVDFHTSLQDVVVDYRLHRIDDDRSPDELIGYNEHGLPS